MIYANWGTKVGWFCGFTDFVTDPDKIGTAPRPDPPVGGEGHAHVSYYI